MQTRPINKKTPPSKPKEKKKEKKKKKITVFNVYCSSLYPFLIKMGLFLCSLFSVIFLISPETCHEIAERERERERGSRGIEGSGGWWVI